MSGASVIALGALAGCGVVTAPGGSSSAGVSAGSASGRIGSTSAPTAPGTSASSAGSSGTPGASSDSSGGRTGASNGTTPHSDASAGTGAAATGRGTGPSYDVVSVVDGDTIKVRIGGVKTTIRLIGVDTPETHKPHVPVECFGPQASSHMQSLVQGKQVQLVAEPNQGDKDKYGRLLRDVYVAGTTNVALAQIAGGFGREYTYDKPYRYRLDHLAAQSRAKAEHLGTWGPPCNGFHVQSSSSAPSSAGSSPRTSSPVSTPRVPTGTKPAAVPVPTTGGCLIKGNINSRGEKIAHLPGSATYAKTRITVSKGERMFCSVADAVTAGWRMAAD